MGNCSEKGGSVIVKRICFIIFTVIVGFLVTVVLISNLGLSFVTIPAIRSVNDMMCFFKMIGETTSVPFVSERLQSIKVSEPVLKTSSFDEDFYPYYVALNEEEKKLYTSIYSHAERMTPSFFVNMYDISSESAEKVWRSVYFDHPEIFWLSNEYRYSNGKNGNVTAIFLEFNELSEEVSVRKSEFEKSAKQFLAGIESYSDSYQKEMRIHNELVRKTEFGLDSEFNQTAYSAIVNHQTVCAGYVKALQYLLMQEGIPCYYVSGESGGQDHAWAIVKLDDGYYNVDPTWNDALGTFSFFNRDESEFSKTHKRCEQSEILPECNGEEYKNNETIPPIVVD